jgi:HAD superfamily hydrolase (TIGR01549 family)
MLSNVGFDLSPTLARTGVDELLDGAVMSYAVGVVKPDPGIFQHALEVLDLPASEVLMVGDAWRDDAGAAALGMRTLILPRTDDPSHGLELVVRLV